MATSPRRFLTRTQWGARAPRHSMVPLSWSVVRFWTLHYDGSGPLAGRDPAKLLRSFQSYHQNGRGFADIAYNSAAFQDGTRAEARGSYVGGHIRGAQNAQSWGVIAAIGASETPTPELLRALREDYEEACRRKGARLIPRGHTQWPQANKPCPGSALMRWLANDMPVDWTIPTTVPPAKPTPGQVVVKPVVKVIQKVTRAALAVDGVRGPATVKALQRWLKVAADGKLGPQTITAMQRRLGVKADGGLGPVTTRALQRLVGATADGIWGKNTTRALQRYLNKIGA